MKKILFVAGIVALVVAAVVLSSLFVRKAKVREDVQEEPVATETEATRVCYRYTQEATKDAPYAVTETIDMAYRGNEIFAIKQGTQSGPGMTNGYAGSFNGKLEGDVITGIFDYEIEGSTNSEAEIYKRVASGLEKQRYPLKEEKGILVPDLTQEYKVMSYQTVACE